MPPKPKPVPSPIKRQRRGGPKPKPSALKKLHGTANVTREKIAVYEPQAETEISTEPPPWMTDEQQASYRYVITHAPRSLLKAIDRGVLHAWCAAEARLHIAVMKQAQLDQNSVHPMLVMKDGQLVISPYVIMQERAELAMIRAASALGFTPAARPRIVLMPALPPVIEAERQANAWDSLVGLHRDAA